MSAPLPPSVLFACSQNSVRSPMAAGLFKQMFGHIYVGSAGVRKDELDPFAVAVLDEIGLEIPDELESTQLVVAFGSLPVRDLLQGTGHGPLRELAQTSRQETHTLGHESAPSFWSTKIGRAHV